MGVGSECFWAWLRTGEGPIFGLTVQDENGRERAWVLQDGPCAEVGLGFGGNTVAALSVGHDGEPDMFLARSCR